MMLRIVPILEELELRCTPTVTVVDAPVFLVHLDATDNIRIDCNGGKVRIFENGTPNTYATNCAAVTTLGVRDNGDANLIDLSEVVLSSFSSCHNSNRNVPY